MGIKIVGFVELDKPFNSPKGEKIINDYDPELEKYLSAKANYEFELLQVRYAEASNNESDRKYHQDKADIELEVMENSDYYTRLN